MKLEADAGGTPLGGRTDRRRDDELQRDRALELVLRQRDSGDLQTATGTRSFATDARGTIFYADAATAPANPLTSSMNPCPVTARPPFDQPSGSTPRSLYSVHFLEYHAICRAY